MMWLTGALLSVALFIGVDNLPINALKLVNVLKLMSIKHPVVLSGNTKIVFLKNSVNKLMENGQSVSSLTINKADLSTYKGRQFVTFINDQEDEDHLQ
jgi:hypothetical protein